MKPRVRLLWEQKVRLDAVPASRAPSLAGARNAEENKLKGKNHDGNKAEETLDADPSDPIGRLERKRGGP